MLKKFSFLALLLAMVALFTVACGSDVRDSKVSEKDGMRQMLVPAGEFTMGSTQAEVDVAVAQCEAIVGVGNCQDINLESEMPQHKVDVAEFWIDETEVTNKMYAQCVAEGGCTPPSDTTSYTHDSYYGNPQFDAYPVIYADWYQATAYCEWAGRRLPTEAEWEKAARGTDGRVYPWGDAFDGTKLNFCDKNCPADWADKTADDGYADVAPVGSYPAGASPYGALDMAGNVWEWTKSKYVAYPYKDGDGRNDENGTDDRVLRGGSWYDDGFLVRAANRSFVNPDVGNGDIGFRCSQD